MPVKLRRGTNTIMAVPPLSVLRVVEVRGNWVGVFVERNGRSYGGWLARTDVEFVSESHLSTTQAIRRVRKALLSGVWGREYFPPGHHDIYRYTFHPDGTYENEYLTDYNVPKIKGEWRLYRDGPGALHLLLRSSLPADDPDAYYWLGPDSVIEYDELEDVLLVSGPKYVAVKELRRFSPAPR
jgi:hypothetical protein